MADGHTTKLQLYALPLGSIKMRKYLSNMHKIDGAHLQCVNKHYTKFEYKGLKSFGVSDYTN